MDYDDKTIAALPDLAAARAAARDGPRCDLAATRRRVVFGAGDPHARLMIVGEAPAANDETTGEPFTGPAGQLLDVWLEGIGLARADVWLTNTLRCRPTSAAGGRGPNRPPRVGELRACSSWLALEDRLVAPAVVVALGATAGKALLGKDFTFSSGRGVWRDRLLSFGQGPSVAPVLPTYHPAYVLRLEGQDAEKAQALVDADLRKVRARLDDPESTPTLLPLF